MFFIKNTPIWLLNEAAGGSFSPSDISNMTLWIDATQETGFSNNDPVGTLSDFSGNNNNSSAQTGSNRCTYNTNVVNSKPGFSFDETNSQHYDFSTGIVATGTTDWTLYAVHIRETNASDMTLFNWGDYSTNLAAAHLNVRNNFHRYQLRYTNGSGGYVGSSSSYINQTGDNRTNDPGEVALVVFRYDNTAGRLYVDTRAWDASTGAATSASPGNVNAEVTFTDTAVLTDQNVRIGSIWDGTTASDYFGGNLLELGYHKGTAYTESNTTDLITYVEDKWTP